MKKETKKAAEKGVSTSKAIEVNPDVPITNIGEEVEPENLIAVISWARMNPVTKGHAVLVDAVYDVAERVNGDAMIFLSHSQDEISNPLPYEDKVQIAQEAFGQIVVNSFNRTIIDVLNEVGGSYDELYLVAGSDRVDDYQKILDDYNTDFGFKKYTVVSAGERDPDSSDVDGVSATKMRMTAHTGNFESFRSMLPETLEDSAYEIYDLVRLGLGYDIDAGDEAEESEMFDEAVLNPMQRIRRGIIMRRNSRKIEIARERMKKKFASNDSLQKRARVHAIKTLRKKFAGQRGVDYETLSSAEKASIDTKVQGAKTSIERIAMKLLPSIRKKELSKMQPKKKINEQFEDFLNQEVSEEVDLTNLAADNHIDTTLKKQKKRFHQMFTKEGKVKHDLRFKMYRNVKKKMQEDLDLIGEAIEKSSNNSFEKIEASLLEKSEKSGIDFETLFEVFARGVESEKSDKVDSVQNGFHRVNSFINEGVAYEIDQDLVLNENFAILMEENACAIITRQEISELEKFADSILDKFKIDINFTKHFGERMSDSRNSPCITVKELREFFRKIALDSGNKIKKAGTDVQAVLKDMQKDLNIPIVIDYMRGEFVVTLKTIMRKKNFTSPDDFIKY